MSRGRACRQREQQVLAPGGEACMESLRDSKEASHWRGVKEGMGGADNEDRYGMAQDRWWEDHAGPSRAWEGL